MLMIMFLLNYKGAFLITKYYDMTYLRSGLSLDTFISIKRIYTVFNENIFTVMSIIINTSVWNI